MHLSTSNFHIGAWKNRLVVFALALSSAADSFGQASSPIPAETAAPTQAGFDVDTLSITAPEIADLLDYKFSGYTWHFSAPTYARLKVWFDVGDDKTPEHPEESAPPEQVLALDGAQSEISIRLIRKETESPLSAERDNRSNDIGLEFHLTFSGRAAGKGLPGNGVDAGLAGAVAVLLPKALADQGNYNQSIGYTESMRLSKRAKQNFSRLWLQSTGRLA